MPRDRKYLQTSDGKYAYINYQERKLYLGEYDSPKSWELYYRLLAQIRANQEPRINEPEQEATINELVLKFWEHVKVRYMKDGKPTSERRSFRTALRPLTKLYGHLPVNEFGPLALKACRQTFIDDDVTRKRINGHVGRIRRCFEWGLSEQIVKESTHRALLSVEGLLPGEARDNPKVQPVRMEFIEAIKPFVTPQIWAMIQFQLFTACRPGEACIVRGCDIVDGFYIPARHKTEHHNIARYIPLGPQAMQLVQAWMKPDLEAYLWSPEDAREWHFANRRENAKGPLRPKKPRVANPKRKPGKVYTVLVYEEAIDRACQKAGIPKWTPNRIRHLKASEIRKKLDLETARVVLGHRNSTTTETYAKVDLDKAKAAMQQLG